MKFELRPRLGRTHHRPTSGREGDRTDNSAGQPADPDLARFGATAGPAGLMTLAALFNDDAGRPATPAQPAAMRHRWRRRA